MRSASATRMPRRTTSFSTCARRPGRGDVHESDSCNSETAPQISVRAIGTMNIKQVDIVKNQNFVYTSHPGTKETRFDFADQDYGAGQNYYYVRVMQDDGQLAWSSPIWVKK